METAYFVVYVSEDQTACIEAIFPEHRKHYRVLGRLQRCAVRGRQIFFEKQFSKLPKSRLGP
jgi:hypothetical protein